MRMTTGRGPVVSQLQVAAAAKAALCTYTNALRCQCVALLEGGRGGVAAAGAAGAATAERAAE